MALIRLRVNISEGKAKIDSEHSLPSKRRMIYAVMIALESGVFADPETQFVMGEVRPEVRRAVLFMIQNVLLSCENLGGPKSHRLDFKRFHATVQRIKPTGNHEDSVIIKPDGIFAKISIPPEGDELFNWEGLKVVTEPD